MGEGRRGVVGGVAEWGKGERDNRCDRLIILCRVLCGYKFCSFSGVDIFSSRFIVMNVVCVPTDSLGRAYPVPDPCLAFSC